MATFTIDVAGVTTSFTIDDADATRMINAHGEMYGNTAAGVPHTQTEIVQRMAQEVVETLARSTVQFEISKATQQAYTSVTPIAVNLQSV